MRSNIECGLRRGELRSIPLIRSAAFLRRTDRSCFGRKLISASSGALPGLKVEGGSLRRAVDYKPAKAQRRLRSAHRWLFRHLDEIGPRSWTNDPRLSIGLDQHSTLFIDRDGPG